MALRPGYEELIDKRVPLARFQFVNVDFTTADEDVVIKHSLRPANPEKVRYEVIRQSGPGVIYQDLSATRLPWQTDYIRLRSAAATSARLLLWLEQDGTLDDFSSGESGTLGGAGASPGGADSEVQYNNGGAFGGDAAFTFNDTTKVVMMDGQYYSPANIHASSGAALSIDFNDGNEHTITLDNNCTFTFSNPVDGGRYTLILIQDGTGSRTVTWPATVVWAGGTTPTLTTTANHADLVVFMYLSAQNKYIAAYNLDYTV